MNQCHMTCNPTWKKQFSVCIYQANRGGNYHDSDILHFRHQHSRYLSGTHLTNVSVRLIVWTASIDKPISPWLRHEMETFSALLAIWAGNSPVTGEFPAQLEGQWRGALMFSLICPRINGWVNNHEAGDLRRHRAHYDVTVMWAMLSMPTFRFSSNIWWTFFTFSLRVHAIRLPEQQCSSYIAMASYWAR